MRHRDGAIKLNDGNPGQRRKGMQLKVRDAVQRHLSFPEGASSK